MTYVIIALGLIVAAILLFLLWLVFISARTAARVEKYLPPLGEFQEIDGNQIHYLERGEGPPIVMIHGLNGQVRNFTYALQERLDNDFRLVIVDRPGSGYSTRKSDDDAPFANQAKIIAEFIKKKGIEKPLIVGHSLGGAVSLALAINHPEVVGGLALISPLTHPRPQEAGVPKVFRGLVIRSPLKRKIISWTFAIPASIKNAKAAVENVFGPEEVPRDTATKGGGLLSLRPKAFYAASTDFASSMVSMPDVSSRYGEIKVPVGIIYGDKDQVLEYPSQGLPMKDKITHIDFETLEGAGHMILMTQPDRVATFIRRMAAKTFSSSSQASQVNIAE